MFESPVLDFKDKSLKDFFFSSDQSMWITDTDFCSFLEVNNSAIKTSGYSKEEIMLQPVEKITLQKEHQKLFELIAKTQAGKPSAKKEISLISQSGKIIYAETVISAILYKCKNAVLFTMTDVTEKKLYRTMLEEAIDEEVDLKTKNLQLKKAAYTNFHLARKPLANILGSINVLDQSVIADGTLAEAIEFLKESSNELDELIKSLDPQLY